MSTVPASSEAVERGIPAAYETFGFLQAQTGPSPLGGYVQAQLADTDLSSNPRIDDERDLRRANNRLSNPEAWKRTISLAVLLAQLHGVSFEDAAGLLGTSAAQLRRMVRFEITVPVRKFQNRILPVAEAVRLLHTVLEPSATGRWLNTPVESLKGRTPAESIMRNRVRDVIELLRSYREPLTYS